MNRTSILLAALGLLLSTACTVNQGGAACGGLTGDGGAGSGGSDDGGRGGEGGAGGLTVNACAFHFCALTPIGKQKGDCDDGDPKTVDRCVQITPLCEGAICVHIEAECDWLDPIDMQQATCDDTDPCTADRCKQPNVCDHLPISDCP